VRTSPFCFLFQAEDGIRDRNVTGVQTCALPISLIIADYFRDIGAKAAFLGNYGAAIGRVFTQLTATLWGSKELFCQLFIELIRSSRLRQVRALIFRLVLGINADLALDIRPVAT